MSKYLYYLVLLLGTVPLLSHAACNRDNGDDVTVTTIPLPSKLLVSAKNYTFGEVLYDSGYISGTDGDVTIKNCSRDYYVGFHYNPTHLASASPVGDNIYPTTIPGIGIKTYTLNQAGPYDYERAVDNSWQSGDGESSHTLAGSAYRVQLIATGGTIPGGNLALESGKLATVEFREGQSSSDNGDNASEVYLSNTQIEVYAMGCSASVSSLLFNMGDVDTSAFDNLKMVEGPEQDVGLSCQPGTNVTMTINGPLAEGDNDNGSVIALDQSESGTTATGVGVVISAYQPALRSFTYWAIGQEVQAFNSSRVKAASQGSGLAADGTALADIGSATTYSDPANAGGAGESETLRFKAWYYKTSDVVTPGQANATGTITLKYN